MKRLVTILIGIVCVVMGIFILITHINEQKTQTAQTTATVIRIDSEMERDSDGNNTRWYYPVVEYAVDGMNYENRMPNGGTTNSTIYKEGQTIEIQYKPDQPEEFSQKGSKNGLFGAIFFLVCGVVVTVVPFVKKQF